MTHAAEALRLADYLRRYANGTLGDDLIEALRGELRIMERRLKDRREPPQEPPMHHPV